MISSGFGSDIPSWRMVKLSVRGIASRVPSLRLTSCRSLVDHPVVAVAEEDEVLEIGRSTPRPMHQVMRVGPGSWAIAAGPAAALVAGVQGSDPGAVDDPLGPPDV